MGMRKALVLLTIAAVGAGMVAGCRQTPTDTPAPLQTYGDLERLDPGRQVVTYWHRQTGTREEALLAMIDDFNNANEWGITVLGQYAGSIDAIYERIRARIGSGAVPEMVIANPQQAAAYARRGALVELTPYLESERWGFGEEELEDFFLVSQGDDLPWFDGRYGFAPGRSVEVIYYNEDWLHELGYDQPPRTFDEFNEMACAATDPDAGTYGYELSLDSSTFVDMLINQGGAMMSDDATAYAFGDYHGLAVLDFVRGLFDEGCAVLETTRYGDQADFGAGKVLFTIGRTLSLPYYRSAVAESAGFNWSVAPMVTTLDTPRASIYGASLSILRTTPEKQLAAWLFIKWFVEPEQSARWARASHYFPVRRSAADELAGTFAENPQYQKAFGFLGYGLATEPGVAGYDTCRESISDMLAAVAAGEDPEIRLADTLAECNASLEEAGPE